ncbi:hypothetical protein CPT06_03825 [Bacillus vallismortis]|nr:hypothetical protein [Bacillus vallismortis]MCO4852073.1 hypothetical protein [Bacillus vallismortis]PJZ01586.1 hypothetical protein CPT06_03825 [Bacillus vallismortis]
MPLGKWFNIFCIVALGSEVGYKVLTNKEISTTHLIIAFIIILWSIIGLFSKEPAEQTHKQKSQHR